MSRHTLLIVPPEGDPYNFLKIGPGDARPALAHREYMGHPDCPGQYYFTKEWYIREENEDHRWPNEEAPHSAVILVFEGKTLPGSCVHIMPVKDHGFGHLDLMDALDAWSQGGALRLPLELRDMQGVRIVHINREGLEVGSVMASAT